MKKIFFPLVLILFTSIYAQKWTTYDYNSSNYTLGATNCVAADASGNIWVGAYNSIVKFDQKNTWTVYNSSNSGYPADQAVDLVFDASNTLWICTYGTGFFSYDGTKWTKYDPTTNTGMPTNYTYCITFDNAGSAYVGIYSGNSQNAGFVKWNKASSWTPYKVFDGYNYKNVEAIAKDKQGNIWCGTSVGAFKYDPVAGTLSASYTKENTNGGLCGNYVRAINVDAAGNIWFGCMDKDANGNFIAGGLSKFNGTSWTNYKPSNSNLSNGYVSAIAFRNSDAWVGTGFCGQYSGNGLYKFDGTNWTNYVSNSSTYPGNCVNEIALDKNNNLWVAGANVLTKIDFNPTAVESENLPAAYQLSQNFPNPFNPSTSINYSIKEAGLVTLKIYDVLGRETQMLVNEIKNPGSYSVKFDASKLSSGVYYYKMISNNFVDIKKMMLVK